MRALTPEFEFAGFTFPRYVADMAIGKSAMQRKRELRKLCGGYYHAPTPNQSRGWGCYDDGSFGMRIERTWYVCFADDTEFHAIIVRLNHGRGFLVGWTMGDNMAMSIDGDIFDDESDAIHCAKSRAQDAADREAEYQIEGDDE